MANKVTIRGLTQTETTLNGREIFSVNDAEGFGRSFNFTAIPTELISAITVYKTSSAKHIEGGVGGSVDIRTYHPFDFESVTVAGSMKASHGDLVKKSGLQLSALLSNRWETSDWGEIGVLVDFSFQDRHYREDLKPVVIRLLVMIFALVTRPQNTGKADIKGFELTINSSMIFYRADCVGSGCKRTIPTLIVKIVP
jgi:outer membrane receptor protein involved in Fe transport